MDQRAIKIVLKYADGRQRVIYLPLEPGDDPDTFADAAYEALATGPDGDDLRLMLVKSASVWVPAAPEPVVPDYLTFLLNEPEDELEEVGLT